MRVFKLKTAKAIKTRKAFDTHWFWLAVGIIL